MILDKVKEKLLEDRVIILKGNIDEDVADNIITNLLYLQSIDSSKDITLYINSAGGSVHSGYAILDIMNIITPDVSTFCIGEAYSMAAEILASGAAGKRLASPHASIMIHQSTDTVSGNGDEIYTCLNQLDKFNNYSINILSHRTGKSTKQIKEDISKDYYMDSLQAKKYGIIDHIVKNITNLHQT